MRRRAHGHFDGDRMIRTLHPERLLPRESCGPVKRESCGYKASKNNSKARDGGVVGGGLEKSDSSRDTAAAKAAAAESVSTQTFTPEPQRRSLRRTVATLAFCQTLLEPWGYGGELSARAFGRWIGTRIARRKRNRAPVVDEQAYARVCVINFIRQHKSYVAEAILSKYALEPPTDPELVGLKEILSNNEALLAEWVRDDDGSDQDAYWIRKVRRRCSYLRGKNPQNPKRRNGS
jgi:hypothetical protein